MPKSALTADPLSQVLPEPVGWLWKPYIPRGKLILFDGDPNVGKSFLSIDLAARLSRGGPLPDGQMLDRPHLTLVLNAEDQTADTIYPRAQAAGADLDRVQSIRAQNNSSICLPRDTDALAALIAERRADLVVIDPMAAFIQRGAAMAGYQAVRRVLNRLAKVSARTNCAILMIRHLRKARAEKALYRGLGSVGIIGAVRVALLAGPLPGNPKLNVFAVSKTNLTRTPSSLGYSLREDNEGRGTIEWGGPVPVTADELGLIVPAPLWPRDRAADWLHRELAKGPRRSSEIHAAAAEVGIPDRTLERAKIEMGVKSQQVMLKNDERVWFWFDPAAPWPKDAPFKRPSLPELFDPWM